MLIHFPLILFLRLYCSENLENYGLVQCTTEAGEICHGNVLNGTEDMH